MSSHTFSVHSSANLRRELAAARPRVGWSACLILIACATLMRGQGAAATSVSPTFTTPLATGVALDPVGDFIDLGSMPMGMVLSPEGDKLAVVLSGWREQGIQVIDLKTNKVTQTLQQEAAFYGLAFSSSGRELYVSGGNEDAIFCDSWQNGGAPLKPKIIVGPKKQDETGSRYPAGLAVSPNGNLLSVVENAAHMPAAVHPSQAEVVARFSTHRPPY